MLKIKNAKKYMLRLWRIFEFIHGFFNQKAKKL